MYLSKLEWQMNMKTGEMAYSFEREMKTHCKSDGFIMDAQLVV